MIDSTPRESLLSRVAKWLPALALVPLLCFNVAQAAEPGAKTTEAEVAQDAQPVDMPETWPAKPQKLRTAPNLFLPVSFAGLDPQDEDGDGEEEEEEPPGWEFSFEAAASASGGNTDKQDFDGRFDVKREWTELALFQAYIRGEWGQARDRDNNNKERTTNRQTAGLSYRRYTEKPLYWFARTDMERDEFQDLRFRSDNFVGVGTVFVDNDTHLLAGEVGAGYTTTDFFDGEDEDNASALLAQAWDWNINENWDLVERFEFISNVEEVDDDFRTQFNIDAKTDINDNMYFSIGFEHLYNAEPSDDADRQDYKVLVKLGFTF